MIFDEAGIAVAKGSEDLHTNYFDNGFVEQDPEGIFRNVLASVKKCLENFSAKGLTINEITSIGIDTWGVDFVCIGKDGEILRNPYSYRDTHTVGAPEEFFKKMPRDHLKNDCEYEIHNETQELILKKFTGRFRISSIPSLNAGLKL